MAAKMLEQIQVPSVQQVHLVHVKLLTVSLWSTGRVSVWSVRIINSCSLVMLDLVLMTAHTLSDPNICVYSQCDV